MKRKNYTVKLGEEVVAVKHSWHTAKTAIKTCLMDICVGTGLHFELSHANYFKAGFNHTGGEEYWLASDGSTLKFTIQLEETV
jgi:hypothetical protein